jgi:hypothetical protein
VEQQHIYGCALGLLSRKIKRQYRPSNGREAALCGKRQPSSSQPVFHEANHTPYLGSAFKGFLEELSEIASPVLIH